MNICITNVEKILYMRVQIRFIQNFRIVQLFIQKFSEFHLVSAKITKKKFS